MSDVKKVLVCNTATHPAMRIPPGGKGEVDESVLEHAKYLVRVKPEQPATDAPAADERPERKPRGKGKPEQPATDAPVADEQPERS